MAKARSEHKKTLRQGSFDYRKSRTQNLEEEKNIIIIMQRYFGSYRGKMCPLNTSKNLTAQHFIEYFRAINNPESMFFQADVEILFFMNYI